VDLIGAGDGPWREHAANAADGGRGGDDAERAANDTVAETLGDEQRDDAAAGGAECLSDGELAGARGAADEEEVGDVDAGDEEDEARGGEEEQQRGAESEREIVSEGEDTAVQPAMSAFSFAICTSVSSRSRLAAARVTPGFSRANAPKRC